MRSGQVASNAALAELPHGLPGGIVDRACPHLHLMLDPIGIGKGDNAAARMHGRQYRRRESEVK